MGDVFCPASMCPLVAPNGSPWTGEYKSPCPQQDDLDTGGCPFWSMACATGAIHLQVDEAEKKGGRAFVVGPSKPRAKIGKVKTFECPNENECSWQLNAQGRLCPPRYALSKGLDPRVCLF